MNAPFAPAFKATLIFCAAVLTSQPALAKSKVYNVVTANDVLALVKEYGEAKFDEPQDGMKIIEGTVDEMVYYIFLYDCEIGKGCRDLVFSAAFDTDVMDLSMINDWNKGSKFGQAYLDSDGDANIDLALNLFGGITHKNLDDSFDWWRVVLSQFSNKVFEEEE